MGYSKGDLSSDWAMANAGELSAIELATGLTEQQLAEIQKAGDDASANEKYEAAKKAGFSGTFSKFLDSLDKAKNKGYLEKGIDLAGKIKDLFGWGNNEESYGDLPPAETETTRILGMKPFVAALVGAGALGLIAFGAYKLIKKK